MVCFFRAQITSIFTRLGCLEIRYFKNNFFIILFLISSFSMCSFQGTIANITFILYLPFLCLTEFISHKKTKIYITFILLSLINPSFILLFSF